MTNSNWIGTGVAGHILGVSSQQVRRYARNGLLDYLDTSLGAVFERHDVERLAEDRAARKLKREANT